MIAIRGPAGRAILSFAQQVSLSILGTLTATAVLAALHADWSVRPAAPTVATAPGAALTPPGLTGGGKFTARAVDGDAPEAFVTLTRLPLLLPLFTAPAVPRLDLDASDPVPAALTIPQAPALSPAHAAPRREAHHVSGVPARPRRGRDQPIAMMPLPDPSPTGTPEDPSLGSRSKALYRTLASWSGAAIDRLLP